MAIDSIPHRLFQQAKTRANAPAYWHKVNGSYRPTTWSEYAAGVKRAGKALLALGFERASTVSILGFNRPEWTTMAIAAMAAGGAAAGIYTTCSPEEVRYIADHAESPVVLVENEKQWAKIERELSRMPRLRHVVIMSGAPRIDHPIVLTWEDFLAKGDGVADERFFERLDAIEPGGLASLIYTSGTTGPPKGVMLSHENLAWTAKVMSGLSRAAAEDVAISYLPLSHIAEQVFSVHGHVTCGYELYFAESIDKLADNLKEARPTIFFGVPRIWEKFSSGIEDKLKTAPAARRKLAETAMRIGRAYNDVKNEGRMPSPLLELAHAVAKKIVLSKVQQAIGLDRARYLVSGAAPIAPAVLEFLAGLDLVVYEVYGQSEDTGPTSITRPGNNKVGTVGPPVPGIEVRFGDDGEILVRGPNVFLGYYKDPEATRDTLVDGWMCSGDLGKLDEAGNLVITGRKKEIIITAGGKNITPKNIESKLKEHPLIAEAVVIGDRRKFLSALLILDDAAVARFASEKGVAPDSPELRTEVQRVVDEANTHFARVESVRKFHILKQPFSIDTGELTPTLKVKRRVVHERYAREIDSMYEE
jgi:long-chain acyl-CoA synthetase